MRIMPIREFLRGGYRTLQGPTVVSSHGRPVFTVMPYARPPITTAPLAAVVEGARGELSPKEAQESLG